MPTLTIGDKSVTVGDEFLKLSPEQQNATVDEIAASLGIVPAAATSAVVAPIGDNRAATVAALRGIPIAGAYVDKATAALNAAAQPLTETGLSKAGTFGERMTENEKTIKAAADQYETEHPIETGVGKFAAGTGALGPLGATGVGAKMLGLGYKTLKGASAASAASGAAIGGADALARGEDPSQGVGIGAGFGLVAPAAGRAIGSAINGVRGMFRPPAVPTTHAEIALPNGSPVKVPLSQGQLTGDFDRIAGEQLALRGGRGEPAQKVAQGFADLQRGAVDDAGQQVARSFDPAGGIVAPSVQEAGEIVGQGVRSAADISKRGYQSAYDQFAKLPGDFESAAFDKLGTSIRNKLTQGTEPVFIDELTTPFSARALKDVDQNLGGALLENRASPRPTPASDTFSIQDLDQARKRLNVLFRDAKSSRNETDIRGMRRIVSAFDDHVETALNSKLFTGDERAYPMLKEARARYSAHQKTFKPQGPGDDVGRTIEKIVGKYDGQAATPTEIANYLYGSANVGARGTSVRVAQRLEDILGKESPEWSAVRQGLWSKLTTPAEGMTEFGPQKVSERVFKFLNGEGAPLAQKLFSPAERKAMAEYAGTLKQMVPPPGAVNYSNTAPTLKRIAEGSLKHILAMIGVTAGGPIGAVAGYATGAARKPIAEQLAASKTARSLYGSSELEQVREKFKNAAGAKAAIAAQALIPQFDH